MYCSSLSCESPIQPASIISLVIRTKEISFSRKFNSILGIIAFTHDAFYTGLEDYLFSTNCLMLTRCFFGPKLPDVGLLFRTLLVIPAVPEVPHHGVFVVAVDVLSDNPPAVQDVVVIVKVDPENES